MELLRHPGVDFWCWLNTGAYTISVSGDGEPEPR
jgi:hypothetical protein